MDLPHRTLLRTPPPTEKMVQETMLHARSVQRLDMQHRDATSGLRHLTSNSGQGSDPGWMIPRTFNSIGFGSGPPDQFLDIFIMT
ncbi:hypothetical protein L1987_76873 [Smallanthus sonchifolius]|uniref:Uncharacterized protein n=1 Tax=Smallanthus sonchifolius TaxID=185202 RepID=A0ACB8Z9A2_9ASTR|nr:hypothetical protein L1987_76873 [Smallanthus sonchifolius]